MNSSAVREVSSVSHFPLTVVHRTLSSVASFKGQWTRTQICIPGQLLHLCASHVKLHISPNIPTDWRGGRKGLCHVLLPSFIRCFHTPHMERNSREKGKPSQANKRGAFYCISHTNAHCSCTTGGVHPNMSPPSVPQSPFLLCPHVSLMFSDGELKIPAFCSIFFFFYQGGQGVTLGKVTDETAGAEGGRPVALKKSGVDGGVGRTSKIDHSVKENL